MSQPHHHPESAQIPEVLRTEIHDTYDKVFSSQNSFDDYFYATPDRTPHDLQVRLGVVIKRLLQEPNERFLVMREHYSDTQFPPTSIHELSFIGTREVALPLNNYTLEQLLAWKKGHEVEPHPDLVLSEDDINAVLAVVLPPNSEFSADTSTSGSKQISVKTLPIGFDIFVLHHEISGDYLEIDIPRDSVLIDADIQAEYAKYYKDKVIPTIIANAIWSLDPQEISELIGKKLHSSPVFDRMYLTPGIIRDQSETPDKFHFYGGGLYVYINHQSGQELGLLADYRNLHPFPGSWFFTTEQLWHALFNSPYPTTQTNPEDWEYGISPTHQMVLTSLDSPDHREKIALSAQRLLTGYRHYTPADQEVFTFPPGFQPIAVSRQGDFAIGFKQVEAGVELCFQVPDIVVIGQINTIQASHTQSIGHSEQMIAFLQKLKQSYQR